MQRRETMLLMEVRAIRSDADWERVKEIRARVFIDEQACPPELEWDEHDAKSRHLLGSVDGTPMATARWRAVVDDDHVVAKLERFAVIPEYRGKGYGRRLVEEVLDDARRAGFDTFLIHAQQHLEGFYHSFGFKTIGEPFSEAGIRHITMRLALTNG